MGCLSYSCSHVLVLNFLIIEIPIYLLILFHIYSLFFVSFFLIEV